MIPTHRTPSTLRGRVGPGAPDTAPSTVAATSTVAGTGAATGTGRRRRRPRGRTLLATCVALVGLLCGACTSLPSAGAPQPFDVSVPDSDPLDLAARAPTKGADPEALVQGFLLACAAGQTDDFATARLFLASSVSARWDPTTEVQVYSTDSTPQVTASDEGDEVSVSAPAVATVAEDGEMALPDEGAEVTRRFTLVQESGEWRISALDDGVVISESSFTAAYQLADLYFPSADGEALVPDPRWFPSKRLPTHLLNGLIAGPATSIAPAVVSALPVDASVPSQGIDVSEQKARVDLEGTAPVTEEEQRLLAWQMSATLQQASAVSSVELVVSGTHIPTTDLPTGPSYRQESAITSGEQGFSTLTGNVLTPLLSRSVVGEDASHPAISPAGSETVAWSSGTGVSARRTGDGRESGQDIASPTWPSVDRLGWVWAASTTEAGGGWTVFSPDGQVVTVASPFTDGSTPTALRVSPDGSRVVIVRRIGTGEGVWVAPVRRDTQGTPVGVGDAVAVAGMDEGVVDVSWAGSSTLVALHSVQGGTDLMIVPLGGRISTITAPAGAEHVTAGSGPAHVHVRTKDGSVLSRSGSVWQPVTAEVQEIEFPG